MVSLLKSLDLPIEPVPYSVDEYREALLKDKKKRARGILFVFNKGIGETIIENVADMKVLLQVLSM